MTTSNNYLKATDGFHRKLTGHGLEETVIRKRDDGDSWRDIAADLSDVLGLDLSDTQLRRWFPQVIEAEREAAQVEEVQA